jgi:hypothetical protein
VELLSRQQIWSLVGIVVFIVEMTGCTSVKTEPVEANQIRKYSTENLYPSKQVPKCKSLLDSYCNYLYSPEVQGNLEVSQKIGPIEVLQGDTQNEFSQVFFRYAQAKLKSRRALPVDFKQVLERTHYFDKLRTFIARSPRSKMSLAERVDSETIGYEIGFLWSSAFNETVLFRMTKKYPGFHKLSERFVPVELDLEKRRLRRDLISEISKAVWRDDKNWQKVEDNFKRLKAAYLALIPKLEIDPAIAENWMARMAEVKLALPGSLPAISNEECSTTTVNAYYYTYLNVITVCAGDFNSEDILQTLAHEMAHALGIDRTSYLFEVQSNFGQSLSRLRKNVCVAKEFSCSEWSEYKTQFGPLLDSLAAYQPQLPEFQRCLKRRATAKPLTDEDVARTSNTIVTDRISALASSDKFLRITKSSIPMRNGKTKANPNYFNPCAYYLWSQGEEPIDDELTTLMYFTAEYRCSDADGPLKMKNAIETAKTMTAQLFSRTLRIEGEFSGRNLLETQGFSSPPYERFADVVGSYAMAELLKKLPEKWDRQNVFLASSSWQCIEPSLASHYPDESAVENTYIFDAHSEGDQRRKELFTTPIREAIGCEKDFEFQECRLAMKK